MFLRRLTVPVAAFGLVAAYTLACSDTSAPEAELTGGSHLGGGKPTLTPQQSGTTNRLQAVSPVNRHVVWASGVGGTYTVTTDGGRTWKAGVVPGAETLQFRDVEAQSEKVAYLLAAGPGDQSRIYRTRDGGKHWTLQFLNQDPAAFYDCFAFWTRKRAITFSDAVNGRFPAIRTHDGRHWKIIADLLPAAQPGEAAFAASGTCVATQGKDRAWIGTAGAEKARILATTDGGDSWQAYGTPIVQGTASSGVATVAFRDRFHGILAGGDLAAPDAFTDNVASSSDGGKTWELRSRTPYSGATFGLAYIPGFRRAVLVTGPGGAAWSPDEGGRWFALDGVENYWAVAFAGARSGWLVGTEGRILKVSF